MEFTGKTVEEAKIAGLKELGITEEEAEITVIEEPVKGLFGKIKKEAVVDVSKKPSDDERALNFVRKLFEILEINAKADLCEGEDMTINVIAEESSEVIGYRGEVLDAIQTLAGAIANIGKKEYKKIVVNCENYRERREETLINLAHKLEEKATEMRRSVILEPMSPFERRIIHTALADSETVKTESEGKEPNRYVVIIPNDKDEFSKPYNAGRNKGNFRGDRRNDRRDGGNRGFRGGNRGFRGGRNDRRDGGRRGSNFGEKKKSSYGFGTYLGNSLKDKN